MTNGAKCHFMCLFAIFGEVSTNVLPVKNGYFLIIEFWEFFTYSGYKSFNRYMIYNYFLPLCDLSFHFISSAFWRTKVLNFDSVIYQFLLLWIMFCYLNLWYTWLAQGHKISSYIFF